MSDKGDRNAYVAKSTRDLTPSPPHRTGNDAWDWDSSIRSTLRVDAPLDIAVQRGGVFYPCFASSQPRPPPGVFFADECG